MKSTVLLKYVTWSDPQPRSSWQRDLGGGGVGGEGEAWHGLQIIPEYNALFHLNSSICVI